MNVPSLRSLALVAGSVLSLGLGASTAQAKTLNVVVLGDSYSSGVGAPSASGTCMRSPYAYGNVYAQTMRDRGYTVNLTSAACGGAVVENLNAQINAVTKQTDLVLFTIGGNDVGFIQIILNCFVQNIANAGKCKSQVESAVKNVPGVQQKVLSRVALLRSKLRPGARVGVLSYPYLANPTPFLLGGTYDAGTAVRGLGDLGDTIITDTAATVNAAAGYELASFIPTKDLFVGHEPDQNPNKVNPQTWINEGVSLAAPVGVYHPNTAGYKAMAAAVLRAGGPDGDFGVAH